MLQKAREYMEYGMNIRNGGPYPDWIEDCESVSIQMKVLILCLMIYYKNKDICNHYACVQVFRFCINQVKADKLVELKEEIDSDEYRHTFPDDEKRKYIVLGNVFENNAKELINTGMVTETSVESIAAKLYSEYFG